MEELIPIFLFGSIAAVAILRPLTKRLGDVLELHVRHKYAEREQLSAPAPAFEGDDVRQTLARIEGRLDTFEQRLDFTESLVETRERPAIPNRTAK